MTKRKRTNQPKKRDKGSVDISTRDSVNIEKIAGTTIRQLFAKIIYRKVYAEILFVLRDIQNHVDTGVKARAAVPDMESVCTCMNKRKNMWPMTMLMNWWPVGTMSQCTTVIIVKSISIPKMALEYMVKQVTIVKNATPKMKTHGFSRFIERKGQRASIKMSMKHGWMISYENMKTSRRMTTVTEEEYLF